MRLGRPRTALIAAALSGFLVLAVSVVAGANSSRAFGADAGSGLNPAPAPGSDQALLKSSDSLMDLSATSGEVGTLDSPLCADGRVCFWRHSNYEGPAIKVNAGDICCSWILVSGPGEWWRSAKNRTSNRKLELADPINVIACINPGGERPSPGLFDRIRVGQQGSRC